MLGVARIVYLPLVDAEVPVQLVELGPVPEPGLVPGLVPVPEPGLAPVFDHLPSRHCGKMEGADREMQLLPFTIQPSSVASTLLT